MFHCTCQYLLCGEGGMGRDIYGRQEKRGWEEGFPRWQETGAIKRAQRGGNYIGGTRYRKWGPLPSSTLLWYQWVCSLSLFRLPLHCPWILWKMLETWTFLVRDLGGKVFKVIENSACPLYTVGFANTNNLIYPLDWDLSGLVDIVIHTVKSCEQLGPDLDVFCFCFSLGEDVKEPTP